MSKLSQKLGDEFVISAEIDPPKGADLASFRKNLGKLENYKKQIVALNVVDNPGSILLMSSLAGSIAVKQHGFEPIYQVTCRDRNALAIQADLLGAAGFSIENILALTGDSPQCKSSDHPETKPVFELDSSSLIKTIQKINAGKDIAGNKLKTKTNFFVGAALTHTATPAEGERWKTKRKLNAGAQFFQSQAIFAPGKISQFLEKYEREVGKDIRKRVLGGVLPPFHSELIDFLKTVPNVIIPERVEKRVEKAKDSWEEGINITLENIDRLRELGLGGVHIMSGGETDAVVEILEKL